MTEPTDAATPQSRLKLTGGRYDDRGFPVDGLPELIQYEKLVLDVAKALWLKDHPGRTRVPKGFAKVVGLRLTRVNDGSATPVLIRPDTINTLQEVDPSTVLDQAQDLVDSAFREIVEFNSLPEGFPEGLATHFVKLGRTLKGDEAIEFGPQGTRDPAKYTQAVRRKFLTASQGKDFPVDGTLVGRITALDTNDLSLSITDIHGNIIPSSYSDEALTSDFEDVFGRNASAPIVRVECTQIIGSNGAIKRVDDVQGLEVFMSDEDTPERERLLELLRLERGWLDGAGEPIDLVALERARDLVVEGREKGLPDPGIFPRPDGSVQVQWITDTDVWTALLTGDGPVLVDYLAPETDNSDEASLSTTSEAIEFFARRNAKESS